MAHAYTPGLKVLQNSKIKKERILPIKGEVLKKKGDTVQAENIIARTHYNMRIISRHSRD